LWEDHEALRLREFNLRDYETRLRALQAEIEASRPDGTVASGPALSHPAPVAFRRPADQSPFVDDHALQAACEKLHRTRELLEVEQLHMRDDRIFIHDKLGSLKIREAEVAAREATLGDREALIAAASPRPTAGQHAVSAITRLTTAPFNMVRSVFRGKNNV
jgi:hypothetical protein